MTVLPTIENNTGMNDLFTDDYYKLVELSRKYVLCLIVDILERANIRNLIESGYFSTEKIIHDLSFVPQSKIPLNWMFEYLVDFGYLKDKKKDGVTFFIASNDLPEKDSDAINTEMLKIDVNVRPSNMLLEKAARGYPDFLLGNKTAVDILFTEDKMELWNKYFSNSNRGYVVHNALAASGLLRWLPDRPGLRILEVGGGTGNAAVYFLKEMNVRGLLDNIEEYIFTDVSPVLLRSGNHTIMRELPDAEMVRLKTLDFERSFVAQGIEPGSLDVVYGVNSLHAAGDIMKSMEYIHSVLKPGGFLLLSECARPKRDGLLFQELIFNLFDNYRGMELSEIRPMPGFLDIESWKKILSEAKFNDIELLSNIDFDYAGNNICKNEIIAIIVKGDK